MRNGFAFLKVCHLCFLWIGFEDFESQKEEEFLTAKNGHRTQRDVRDEFWVQHEVRTGQAFDALSRNDSVGEGSTRLWRVVFGVPPNT